MPFLAPLQSFSNRSGNRESFHEGDFEDGDLSEEESQSESEGDLEEEHSQTMNFEDLLRDMGFENHQDVSCCLLIMDFQ